MGYSIQTKAQSIAPINGIKEFDNSIVVFKNANIVVNENTQLENALLLIQKGKIIDVGPNIKIPEKCHVIDLNGKYIYPAFIDIYSNYGIGELKQELIKSEYPKYEQSVKGPYYWNDAVKSYVVSSDIFSVNKKAAEELRSCGFGYVNTGNQDGIFRGYGMVASLMEKSEKNVIEKDKTIASLSFNKGSSKQEYPSSLMGAIALIRQSFLDADWYAKEKNPEEYQKALIAINEQRNKLFLFEANHKLNILRAKKIADEFKINCIYKTSGDEYQIIHELKSMNLKLAVPLNFPVTPDVEDINNAALLDLEDMKHWEAAPFNLSLLEKNNIPFCITSSDLKNKNEFLKNLRKAVEKGLTKKTALKALTTNPASWLDISSFAGSIEKGKQASFFIADDDIFKKSSSIQEVWIKGERYNNNNDLPSAQGEYKTTVNNKSLIVSIKGEGNAYTSEIKLDSLSCKSKVNLSSGLITINTSLCNFPFNNIQIPYTFSDAKEYNGKLYYPALSTKGKYEEVVFLKTFQEQIKKDSAVINDTIKNVSITFPNMAYGFNELPKQEKIFFKGATVWTNEKDGIIENCNLLVENGKIAAFGKSISAPAGAKIINAEGMHLTPGIIDEHSHIAISGGVNEGTHTSTAEVNIGDVINSDDINIYRQLSGGVTAAQLLHGSANPIGGQSGIIKLRWGQIPEKMKFEGADGFIKFALGENVKQSNWGDRYRTRYPQSRMGVEQTYYEYFTRALEYKNMMNKKEPNKNLRRDLNMEATVEILDSKRFISCHSYQQGEINMLMHVADSFKFKVNTFTHILEGYKVADKMKKHGVGASTFADWWAYKFEVHEAIPYNAALMSQMGIVTAVNSDDAEMGRRLNQEAAKAVKYGKVSEEEAFKMCSLNPAILLHLDKKTGSVKTGKDADLVLWTANPLSMKAKVKYTLIDGAVYFDMERDMQMRATIESEKTRLLNAMLKAKKSGEQTEKPKVKPKRLYHCDDLSESTYLDEF